MTVNDYKAQNPGKLFYLKGTQGHIFHPIAVDGMIPEVYASKVTKIGRMKKSGIPVLHIEYDFLKR